MQFVFSEVDFKTNHHPYYVYEEDKNKDFIISLFMGSDCNEGKKLYGVTRRLNEICEPHANNKNNFRILVDA